MTNYTILPVHGCFQSFDSEGKKLIYSGTEWECRFWTEEFLNNQMKDGRVVNSGVVGGKL